MSQQEKALLKGKNILLKQQNLKLKLELSKVNVLEIASNYSSNTEELEVNFNRLESMLHNT